MLSTAITLLLLLMLIYYCYKIRIVNYSISHICQTYDDNNINERNQYSRSAILLATQAFYN